MSLNFYLIFDSRYSAVAHTFITHFFFLYQGLKKIGASTIGITALLSSLITGSLARSPQKGDRASDGNQNALRVGTHAPE
ncbi:hypothetical protein [Calothrix sp. NIES-2100]|uniref:hypothetical protein n=1 Tax=Calothrix sp. NIES-2100 TaxID=1954172 RepID=UPI0030D8FA51